MCRVISNVVAIFDESVNRLRCPGLTVFEDCTEFLELRGGELRRPAAAEARAEPINTIIIPRACPATRRGSGDPDASPRLLACIALIEILDKTEPPDEGRVKLEDEADEF